MKGDTHSEHQTCYTPAFHHSNLFFTAVTRKQPAYTSYSSTPNPKSQEIICRNFRFFENFLAFPGATAISAPKWFSYRTTISVFEGLPSPTLFTAMMRYSSSLPLSCLTKAASVIIAVAICFFQYKKFPLVRAEPAVARLLLQYLSAYGGIVQSFVFQRIMSFRSTSPFASCNTRVARHT